LVIDSCDWNCCERMVVTLHPSFSVLYLKFLFFFSPHFSVWQKLEEENEEFFKAYYARLVLKQQILQFNKLLDQQVQLMQLHSTAVASLPTTNGSHIPAVSSLPNSNGSHIPASKFNTSLNAVDTFSFSMDCVVRSLFFSLWAFHGAYIVSFSHLYATPIIFPTCNVLVSFKAW